MILLFKLIFRLIGLAISILSLAALILLAVGLFRDVRDFDRTSGGLNYPFTGWTGEPIDFDDWYTTDDGLFHSGHVIDLYVNCSTGEIEWSPLGMGRFNFREFSDRAKVVHRPQDTCRERGFNPSAWEAVTVR